LIINITIINLKEFSDACIYNVLYQGNKISPFKK